MQRKVIVSGLVFSCVLGGLLCGLMGMAGPKAPGTDQLKVGPDISLLKVSEDGITVRFDPPKGKSGTLEAELYELGDKLLAKVTRRHKGRPLEVDLFAQMNDKDLTDYYLRYRFNSSEEFRQRSLLFVGEILETTVLGQREFVAGTRPVIRVLVRDRAGGVPIAGAQVSVELTHEDRVISKSSARTDKNGEVAARLEMPDTPLRNARLKVVVQSKTATDTVEETVQVRSALRTLLTTDKPLYQPGQTIHIRALTLSQPDMTPLAEAQVIFEVEDAKGNKVFKTRKDTDEYGISHTDFVLADELNMGTYRIRAIVAGAKEEKTVTVQRYVLPKFKINLESDRSFYQPGDTVKGEIQVDYFFGKPVTLGKVEVKCSKFDVEYVDFQSIEGKTDDKGHYSFEVRLPDHFVGQPLEAGKASAKFEIKVIDTADHKETVTKNVAVTASPIIVAAVPEGGELIPELENKVYIVTTYADSKPAKCRVTWTDSPGGRKITIETDKAGFGEVTLKPQAATGVSMSLTAKDAQGHTGRASVQLKTKERKDDDSVLLRTDKSLYSTGEPVKLSIFSTRASGTVYVDLIKDRQTYLTRTLELQKGKVSDKVVLDATLAGTVQINAYIIGSNGVIIRDRRLALVDPANDLSIEIDSDNDTYLPGTEASLKFKVTNKRGRGVASALGVMVVDEAVFALQEMQPGLEKVYFYLEKEIATPRYEIHGYDLDTCISPPRLEPGVRPPGARRDTAARVLLASAKGVGDYPLHVNTFQRDNKDQAFQKRMAEHMMGRYQKVREALSEFSRDHRENRKKHKEGIDLEILVKAGYLRQSDAVDSWGGMMKIVGQWFERGQNYSVFVLMSAGIDGKWETVDDVMVPFYPHSLVFREDGRLRFRTFLRRGGWAGNGGLADFEAMNGLALGERRLKAEVALNASEPMATLKPMSTAAGRGGAAEPIRIRQYFPETLYFNPAVITDGRGRAVLNVPLADSITTWRLTCMASSLKGQLGSTTAGIRVFQDFFVDVDFPVSLTQNDQVHVPVAIYNYLKTD
ncbi:MAG: MG2 domain-containing protein, partial [Planctomycetota bacterium]